MSETQTLEYKSLVVTVTNAQPGDTIGLNLSPIEPGQPQVAYSTGQPFVMNRPGIVLESTSGSEVPVQSFSVNQTQVSFTTSSSGGGSALSFKLTVWIAAPTGVQGFGITSTSNPDVDVAINFNNTKDQTLQPNYTTTVLWGSN